MHLVELAGDTRLSSGATDMGVVEVLRQQADKSPEAPAAMDKCRRLDECQNTSAPIKKHDRGGCAVQLARGTRGVRGCLLSGRALNKPTATVRLPDATRQHRGARVPGALQYAASAMLRAPARTVN